MPQLADEYTREPEAIARERRLRAMLNAPIQAIPSGYGSVPAPPGTPRSTGSAVPRTALPAWVQARLDAQDAERRRQEELAAVEAAPRVQVRPPAAPPTPVAPAPRPAAVTPSTGSLADDAALHDPRTRAQRLREILDAPMQGIGAGIGTYADPPPTPRPVTPLTREQEEALFEPALRQERQAARGGGPSAYNALRSEQQLWEVGLAEARQAEVGSESAYERARNLARLEEARRAEEEAERVQVTPQVRDDLVAHAEAVLRRYGAAYQLTPATYVAFSERGLNGRSAEGRFEELTRVLGYSAAQIEQLMAGVGVDEVGPPTYANGAPTRSQREGAARLLAADENDDVFGFVDQGLDAIGRPIEWGLDRYIDAQQAESDARERVLRAAQDAAESLADRIEDEWTRGIESVDETINKLSGIAEFLESFGPTQRTPEQLENFREELERVGMVMSDDYVAFSNDPQIRWRLRNGIVALLTTHSSDDPALTRFWDGVTGRRDFLGDENPVRDVLPEPLEDPGVYLTEKIADPVTIAEIVAALLLPGPLKLKLAAFGLDLGFDVVDDLTD